ncbi:spore wall synthesis complex protein [Dactylosporangium cerinum]|uniref:Membrane protein n=1 Tax=Dactylosporangium siamense TaxID=685454 RepID=A0A919PV90_9ACTN|nr:membrane protein [Dactylosporangium siamense]
MPVRSPTGCAGLSVHQGRPSRPGRSAVPLSEHEQRLFEQIERSLAEDPKFASAVRATDPRFHAKRRMIAAAVLLLAGMALLVYGVAISIPLLGVGGFVVMLGALFFGVQAYRRGQSTDLHAVGGTATRRTRQRRAGLVDRLEERWRRRPEGDA